MKDKLSRRLEYRHWKVELRMPVCCSPSRIIALYQMASQAPDVVIGRLPLFLGILTQMSEYGNRIHFLPGTRPISGHQFGPDKYRQREVLPRYPATFLHYLPSRTT